MRTRHRQRGVTLVETVLAMGIMVIGAVGMIGLNNMGVRMNGDGRRMTRASAIAQDLVNQMQLWDYTDPRLVNTNTTNDADVADSTLAFEGATSALAFDHAEAELEGPGLEWHGIPVADLATSGYVRYWNVAEPDDLNKNGVPDGKRIAVIVRWPQGAGFRRIVVLATRTNPADRT